MCEALGRHMGYEVGHSQWLVLTMQRQPLAKIRIRDLILGSRITWSLR